MFDAEFQIHIFMGWVLLTVFSACAISRLISTSPVGWKFGLSYAMAMSVAVTVAVYFSWKAELVDFSDNYAGFWMIPSMLLLCASGIAAGIHARSSQKPALRQQWSLKSILLLVCVSSCLVFLNAGPHKRTTIVVEHEDGTKHLNHNNKRRFGWPWEMHGSLPIFLADVAAGASVLLATGTIASSGIRSVAKEHVSKD